MLYFPELGITCHNVRLVVYGCREGEAVGIRDTVFRLEFSGLEGEAVRYRKNGESQALYVSKDLDLLLIAEGPFYDVNDLAKIDCADQLLCFCTMRVVQKASDLLMPRFLLQEPKEGMAIKEKRAFWRHL